MYMYKGQIGGLEIGIAELRCNVRGKEVGERIQS